MKKILSILALAGSIAIALHADQADAMIAALAARNDAEASRILQNLALTADFEQLDRIQARDYGLFGAKHFPGEFIEKIIRNYDQIASLAVKAALAAKGVANPHDKGSWQSSQWDLDKAIAGQATTKDAAVQKALTRQADEAMSALVKLLSQGDLADADAARIGLYLLAQAIDPIKRGLSTEDNQRLRGLYAAQSAAILEYLFKAGVPLPTKPPASLTLEEWGREVAAFGIYHHATSLGGKTDFETDEEFVARTNEWTRLVDLLLRTELAVPATLSLGAYDLGKGYFTIALSLPALDQDAFSQLIEMRDLETAEFRYYIDRKAAAFFKEKGFARWTATAIVSSRDRGLYGLKELQVQNGKESVTQGLWGFSVLPIPGEPEPSLVSAENYLKDKVLTINGTKVPGAGKVTIPVPADGIYTLASAAGGPGLLFRGDIAKLGFSGSKEIAIGAVGPVTGEAATFGVSTKNAYEMAIAEWNAEGGLLGKQIKLVFADDKGDPTEGASVYTKLIQQDKVVGIVGTVMSKVSLAGAPIAQAASIPMISPTSTNPMVTEVGDFIFRACFIDPFQGTVGAQFAFDDLGARKAAAIFDSGNDYAKGLSEFFKAKFEALGGQVVAFEGHATGTTDFYDLLTAALWFDPDVLYLPDYYNDVALIARQARELGFEGPLVGGDGWDSPDLVEIGGVSVENGFFTNHYSPEDTRPIVQDFVKKYQAKYGAAPDALATLGYDAMTLMLDAIKRAGKTDGKSIRDAMKATDLGVVSGQVRFDASRNPVKSAVIIEIKGGKQIYRTTINP